MIDLKKIDKDIAEKLGISLLAYSSDRRYSAIVVEEIREKPAAVIEEFDNQINIIMDGIKKTAGRCAPSDFLLFITSLDICEAALFAIQQYNEKATL